MLDKVLWEMLIFTWYGIKVYRDWHKLACKCFYVFMNTRGEAIETETQALTFVYAFPPLSSCRENRKIVMNLVIQLIQLHITEASNYRAPTRELKLQAETTLMVSQSMAQRPCSHGRFSKSALKYPGYIFVWISPNQKSNITLIIMHFLPSMHWFGDIQVKRQNTFD